MPSKLCTGCDQFFPKEIMRRGRCPGCVQAEERRRGTRQQRGKGGADYDAFARWIKSAAPGCSLCDQTYGDPSNPITVGHKIPHSLGGQPVWENFQPECRRCNLSKGSS